MSTHVYLDLDGTLTDPYEGITKCILYALDELGFPHPDDEYLYSCIGPPLWDTFPEMVGEALTCKAVDLYREATRERGVRDTAYETWAAFRTDEYFRLPAIALADALAQSGAYAYLYRFDYPIPAFRNALGACHAAEVPLVFGTHRTRWLRPLYLGRRAADELAGRMQAAWLAFARSGVPGDAELDAWPGHDPSSRPTRILDAAGRADAVSADPESSIRAFWMSGASQAP